MILPITAERTGGLCMPCKQGIRENIEASKRFYEEQKKYDPHRELWKSLVHRFYKTPLGFDGLTADEKLYYSVSILKGEVYNGGFMQFFDNSSGGLFREAVTGLEVLGAYRSLDILLQASKIVFHGELPPADWEERRKILNYSDSESLSQVLDGFDESFYEDSDSLDEKLIQFATIQGLVAPFLK